MPRIPWEDIDWATALLTVALVVAVVVAIVKGWGIPARITRVLDMILGRPAEQGVPAIPSFEDRLKEQAEAIAEIRKQVTPNHGTSAHDKITRRISRVDAKVDAIFAHLGIKPPDVDDIDD